MSTVNCDSCANLREYAPAFVQNGVTDDIAASLKNNTGLNPALTVLHKNCEDLNAVNDCLIGRMPQELESYDVCDWKDFQAKFLPNLYESEKAQIASMCGLWSKTDALCLGVDSLFGIVGGSGATEHWFKPIEAGLEKWQPGWTPSGETIDPADCHFTLQADILSGAGCNVSRKYARYRVWCGPNNGKHPYVFGFSWKDIQVGDVLAVFYKDEIVPKFMPESIWQGACAGGAVGNQFCTINNDTIMRVACWGNITIDGVEFHPQLAQYGEENLVLMVSALIGPSHTGGALGAVENVRVVPF